MAIKACNVSEKPVKAPVKRVFPPEGDMSEELKGSKAIDEARRYHSLGTLCGIWLSEVVTKLPLRWMLAAGALAAGLVGVVLRDLVALSLGWWDLVLLAAVAYIGVQMFSIFAMHVRTQAGHMLHSRLLDMASGVSFHAFSCNDYRAFKWTDELREQAKLLEVVDTQHYAQINGLVLRFRLDWTDMTPARMEVRLAEFLFCREMQNFRYELEQHAGRLKQLVERLKPAGLELVA